MNHVDPTEPHGDRPGPPTIGEAFVFDDHHDLLRYLFSHGHFHEHDADNLVTRPADWLQVRDLQPNDVNLSQAIQSWQSFRPKLKRDGIFGPHCHAAAAAETGYRCGLPDVLPRAALGARWPDACKHQITSSHQINSLTYNPAAAQSINDAWDRGLTLWVRAADLTLTRVTPDGGARIHARASSLGPYILAWSELANGNCNARLSQAYNSDFTWQWLLLWSTICHEIGHAIGIGHGGAGIMQPAHDPSVTELGTWDIDQAIARYGQPAPPPPPPPPPPGSWHHARIQLFDADDRPIKTYDLTPRCSS